MTGEKPNWPQLGFLKASSEEHRGKVLGLLSGLLIIAALVGEFVEIVTGDDES